MDCNTPHDTWKFCGGGMMADRLAALVLAGVKTATSSAKLSFDLAGDALTREGSLSVILFDNDEAACVIQDTKVSIVPFSQVSAEHAFKEGEDDRSLRMR